MNRQTDVWRAIQGGKYDLMHLGADLGILWLAMSTAEKKRVVALLD